jgi:Carboxypeptidase regulatory-like domain
MREERMASRKVLYGGVLAALALVWWGTHRSAGDPAPDTGAAAVGRDAPGAPAFRRFVDGHWVVVRPGIHLPMRPVGAPDGLVRVRGTVREARGGAPVANVEVVYSGVDGEATTQAGADGSYQIDVPAGAYRAFVRADGYVSVGFEGPPRLPAPPSADDAGAPVDELAPLVAIARDESGVDLRVDASGTVRGRVFDKAGHPVPHAVVRAHGSERPILGTDVAETDTDGTFRLDLPVGAYALEATHPDYAGLDGARTELDVAPGARPDAVDLTLVAGCVIRGHVVAADGGPAADGAIERLFAGRGDFGPAGRIGDDGTFRWATVEEADIELRAWPWKSPPSPARTFRCTEGARYDVTFQLPGSSPDLDGTIATADGRAAPGAFLDIFALSPGGMNQQERADADGHWAVYALPAGEYLVTATVDGSGAVQRHVQVPAHGVALALGGTGAVTGTVAGVDDGTVTMVIGRCEVDADVGMMSAPAMRLVPVHAGHFVVSGVPACKLSLAVQANDRSDVTSVEVAAGQTATASFDVTAGAEPPDDVDVDHGPYLDESEDDGELNGGLDGEGDLEDGAPPAAGDDDAPAPGVHTD